MLLTLLACGPEAEESPKTLEEMTQIAVTDFGKEEEADHVAELVAWLEDNRDEELDGWYFGALPEEAVADLEHSDDIVWEECRGAGVVMVFEGSFDAHVSVQAEADQTFADSTYSAWDRCSVDGTATDFLAGADWNTDNDVEKTNVGITIPYGMFKNYRWFGDTLAALSWVPEAGFNDAGDNGIVGGFTLELWYETDDGIVWYNGQWSDLVTVLDDLMADNPDAALDLLISGTRDYMEGTTEHVLAGESLPLAEACP